MCDASCAKPRVGFLAIGRQRPGFDPEWGARIDAAARKACAALLPTVFPRGAIVDDPSLREALAEFRAAGCDGLVVLQPTMGDGRLVPILAQQWQRPVVLWATPERPDVDCVSSCSLVGTHVFASTLRQLQHPFELIYGGPDDRDLHCQLVTACRLTAAAGRLRHAKIGLIGNHAPGFINMHADPIAIHQQLGAELHHLGLAEFVDSVAACEQDEVTQDVEVVRQMELPMEPGLQLADLEPNSRYYLALSRLLDDERLDAVALRCWPELPAGVGHWPYLAMMRLTERQRVVALEGDVDGAILGLLGKWLGLGPGYLSDWLAHDAHSITLWHPGHAPRAWCTPESLQLGRHFNNAKPLVVNGRLRAEQELTLARLWRCDDRYCLTAFAGCTAVPGTVLRGTHGVVEIDGTNVADRFDELCHAGMPHHVTLFPGNQVRTLRRLARQLAFRWIG